MTDADGLGEVRRELDRVVDRLATMPITRASLATADCRLAAETLVAQTRRLTDDIPGDATLPDLGPHGLAAMIAVVGADYVAAASAIEDADTRVALDALTALRRALP